MSITLSTITGMIGVSIVYLFMENFCNFLLFCVGQPEETLLHQHGACKKCKHDEKGGWKVSCNEPTLFQ